MTQTTHKPDTALQKSDAQDDVWIPSACAVCFNQCSIKVHRVNGVVTKIEGNPDSPIGMGRICAKGMSGIPLLYDPSRVTTPMKRTNPKKDFDEDPGWVPISWDEALDTMTEKMKKIRADDPRKLMGTATVLGAGGVSYWANNIFMGAFGSANIFTSNGHQCGNAEHVLVAQMHGAITSMPDFDHCKYLLVMGAGIGGHAYYAFTTMAQKMADARARGMKLVVVDPVLNGVAEKADEWIPIRPGSDGAMAMAMLHVILNELEMYDAPYLIEHTNAIYLVEPKGDYARDEGTGKPLIWDKSDERAKRYDDPTLKDPALEGSYQVRGQTCHTAFSLLRERAAEFTPEWAEQETSVPEATIRRIATEFATEARIGSTIVIEGKTLPHRPVCFTYFKGSHAHNHAWLTCMAFELLTEVVGACDVPGGLMGTNPVADGYPETGLPRWAPFESVDGLMSPGVWAGATGPGLRAGVPYPPREPQAPELINLTDLLCTGMSGHPSVMAMEDLDKFKIPYKPEMLLLYGTNLLYSLGNPEITANFLKQMYVVQVKLWLDETSYFADMVLPDTCYLERLEPVPNNLVHHFPVGMGDWAHVIRQPVVDPPGECRPFQEVMIELAERIGFLPDMNSALNHYYGLQPPYALELDQRYNVEDIADRIYKCWFGPEHGLEYMKEHGVIKWPKKVEEIYWKGFRHVRSPIYFAYMQTAGEKIQAILDELGVSDIDTGDYNALPGWKRCATLDAKDEEYDMQAIYHRVAHQQFSYTFQNPWLNEINAQDPYTNYISINAVTARRKGIADGDDIWVRAKGAGSTLGVAKLVEGIHPEVVAIPNNGGHWAKGMPVAKDKGTFFEPLMTTDWAHTDPIVIALDADAAVKIEKARPEDKNRSMRWGKKGER